MEERTDGSDQAGTTPADVALVPLLEQDQVLALLGTQGSGLSEAEAEARRSRMGPNRIEELPGPGWVRRLAGQFIHLFALLLWAGAALAFLVGQPGIGIAIIAVIVLNGVFGFLQENRAERAVAELKRLLPMAAGVIRGGQERRIPAEELVPGDVLVLEEGARLSADARLIEASEVRCDESNLTGEAVPVHKVADPEREAPRTPIQAHNMVFAGSTIISGGGSAVVTATGMRTEFGRIAQLTQAVQPEPSPLQVEVGRVAQRVALLSVAMGVGFFAIGYLVAGLTLRNGAIFAIGIVLANVPEGLLPTMTLALAMGVQRMAARNAIVKRLSSVETLGSCTVICTDKTGTITNNQMTVKEVWASRRLATVTGAGYRHRVRSSSTESRRRRPTSSRSSPSCGSATCATPPGWLRPRHEGAQWRMLGDPTEGALLVAAAKAGLDRAFDERLRPVVRKLAFEPKRKRMSTIHRALPQEGQLVAYVKGAPEELLEHCDQVLLDGREVALTESLGDEVMRENDRMARAGMRVLAMAYRYLPPEDEAIIASIHPGRVEEELVFAGLAGMHDPAQGRGGRRRGQVPYRRHPHQHDHRRLRLDRGVDRPARGHRGRG